jgi:putative DNA primase/helicase
MRPRTLDAARGKWFGILVQMGIDEHFLRNKHGPCPVCAGRDRFRFDDKNGDGTWICSQCGSGTGIKLLMGWKGWDFKTAAHEVDQIVGNVEAKTHEKEKADPVIRLKKIASGLADMASINPVRMYLARRGLTPTPATKYHPALAHYGDDGMRVFPAMVCLFHSADGRPLSFHVTYLTKDGKKAPVESPRKVMPPVEPLNGSAIRLFPISERVGIAEGVETALAVYRDFGVPCWAAANAGLMERFIVPDGIKEVAIFADNDANYTGQKAAFALANRLSRTHGVSVHVPEVAGSDFADYPQSMTWSAN